MAFVFPNVEDVRILDSDPEDFFPAGFNTGLSVIDRDSGLPMFGKSSRTLTRATAIQSSDKPSSAEGVVFAFGVPLMGTGLSGRTGIKIDNPIDNLGNSIRSIANIENDISLSNWTCLNGYVEYDENKSYYAAFCFGLSGFYTGSTNNSYHFRWVFINHSSGLNNLFQAFYIDADDSIRLYDENDNDMGTIAQRLSSNEAIVTKSTWKFLPDDSSMTWEMFMDRMTLNGIRPTNVVSAKNLNEWVDYSIDQNSWGVNDSGFLTCRPSNHALTSKITLTPFNLSATADLSARRIFTMFGTKRRINSSSGGVTKIFPCPSFMEELIFYRNKNAIPFERWIPAFWGSDENNVAGFVNLISPELIPTGNSDAPNPDRQRGTIKTNGWTQDNHFRFEDDEFFPEEDNNQTFMFSHWDTSDGKEMKSGTLAEEGFDITSTISAHYIDNSIVASIESVDGVITETKSNTRACILSDTVYEPNKGYDLIIGGADIGGTLHTVSSFNDSGIECMKFDMFGSLFVSPDIISMPNPLSGDSVTFMGWFKMSHNGMIRINDDLTISRFNPSDAHFNKLMSLSSRTEGNTIVDVGGVKIPYVSPHCLGGWGRPIYICAGTSFFWDGNYFYSKESNVIYGDINTNGGFSGFDLNVDLRFETDPRKCLNMTMINSVIANNPEDTNYHNSTGQLIKKDMPSGYTNDSYLPEIRSNFDLLSDEWTFVVSSFDPGPVCGIYSNGRATRLGYIRNKKGTHLVTNPSLRNLSCALEIERPGSHSTAKRDDAHGWTVFARFPGQSNNGIATKTIPTSGLWTNPEYLCKYIKVFNRAFTEEELDDIYDSEKGMFT